MTVLLPNTTLGVRRRQDETERNSHGERIPSGWGPVVGLYDGRTHQNPDGTWRLGLDTELLPIRQGDLVISTGGHSWLVTNAETLRNNYDSSVDWVRVTANLRSQGGTEPGDAWFISRYTDDVPPALPSPDAAPVLVAPGLYSGNGAPPDDLPEDVEYIDLSTGIIYGNREDHDDA